MHSIRVYVDSAISDVAMDPAAGKKENPGINEFHTMLRLLLRLLPLIATILMATNAGATVEPARINLADGAESWSLIGHADFFQQPHSSLTLDDILDHGDTLDFQPIVSPISLGLVDADVWIRMVIDGRGNAAPVYLAIQPAVLSGITIFVENGKDGAGRPTFLPQEIGNDTPLPVRARFAAVRAAEIIPLEDRPTTVFLKVWARTNLSVHGTVYSSNAFMTQVSYYNLSIGFFVGCFAILTILNLIHWLYIRDRDYARYGIFTGAMCLFMICSVGIGPDITSSLNSELIREMLLPLTIILTGTVVAGALNTRPSRLVRYGLRFCLLVTGTCMLFWPFVGIKQIMIYLYAPAIIVLLIGMIGSFRLALVSRAMIDWLGVVAFSAPFAGIIVLLSRERGLLPAEVWTDLAFQKGVLIFACYLTASMAIKTHRLWNEQKQAKDEAIRLSRLSEIEALRLVETRTAELRLAKETAELALAAEQASKHEQIRFIDVVAHQFKTPLAIIKSNTASIMMSLAPLGSDNQARFTRIDRAIGRLVKLLDITAHRSRLSGFAAKPAHCAVKLSNFTRDIVATKFALMGEGRSISIAGHLPEVTVLFDPTYLELVLANLIDNAVKFSPPEAPVVITCSYVGDIVEWTVTDEGIGIPEEERARLTERFFRASNSGNTVGMGVGLHMVEVAVRAHDGEVQFHRREDRGSMVVVRIRAAEVPDMGDVFTDPPERPQTGGPQPTLHNESSGHA